MRAPFVIVLTVGLACVSGQASAEERSPAVAEALFRDAKRLLEQNEVAEACSKFAESMKLDPTVGTQLNLALCHERQGKVALAWSEMSQVLASSLAVGNEPRSAYARARVAELEKRLAHARIEVAPRAGVTELTVDGQGLGTAAWGVPVPLDAGEHVFVFSGGDRHKTLKVRFAEGETQRVALTSLDDGKAPTAAHVVAPRSEGGEPSHTRRTAGLIVGGLGVVGLGVGAAFGLHALSKKSDVDADCVGPKCSPAGLSAADDAATAATVSTIGIGIGVAGVAAGTYLLLADSRGSTRRTTGLVFGGLGVVGLGASAVFGLRALSNKSDVDAGCVESKCSPAGLSAADDARTAATLSTVGLGVGVLGIAAGSYLVLTSNTKASAQVRISPAFAGQSRGLQLNGEF